MEAPPLRIVLLGKTGTGKSSSGNTLLGAAEFKINLSANPRTSECKTARGVFDGTPLCVVDTPGFFGKPDTDLRAEVITSIVECTPGPHAFLIFLKVEKHTVHEKTVVSSILQTFSEEALRYVVLVFTHGDQLAENTTIEDFVSENQDLCALYDQCGGRCHVIDNKYWKKQLPDPYRNNQVQVGRLLDTIKRMVARNGGGCYTNDMLQEVGRRIQEEEEKIRLEAPHVSAEDPRQQAQSKVFYNILKMTVGISTGVLMGALFGVSAQKSLMMNSLLAGAVPGPGLSLVQGGFVGFQEASKAASVTEAVMNTAAAVGEAAQNALRATSKGERKCD